MDNRGYAVSILNKEKMRLVRAISFWMMEINDAKAWIESFKKEAADYTDKDWYKNSLDNQIDRIEQYEDAVITLREQLRSVSRAISILKKSGMEVNNDVSDTERSSDEC